MRTVEDILQYIKISKAVANLNKEKSFIDIVTASVLISSYEGLENWITEKNEEKPPCQSSKLSENLST